MEEIQTAPKRNRFRNCLIWVISFVIVFGVGFYFLYQTGAYQSFANRYLQFLEPPFPELTEPKNITLSWTYKKQKYSISQTYYKSVFDYYNKKPKGVIEGKEEKTIGDYLKINEKDSSINNLIGELQKIGKSKGFSDDQILELAVSLVQAIPYDKIQAETDKTHPRYPYEVLYENKGICSDKSFLMTAIIQKLEYGSAVFYYNKDQHMSSAVKCPTGYINYNSQFCIVETTATGNKIGIIPKISNTGQASLESYDQYQQNSKNDFQQLAEPIILNITDGTTYQGIIKTKAVIAEIAQLSKELSDLQKAIDTKQGQIDQLDSTMKQLESAGKIDEYNAKVLEYNSLAENLQNQISIYNSKVNRYNELIQSY